MPKTTKKTIKPATKTTKTAAKAAKKPTAKKPAVKKAKTATTKTTAPKRGPGRPKGSKNKSKTPTNDRLQAVFGADGKPEAGSEPKPVPIPKATKALVQNGGVVMEAPMREPSQIMNTVDLPKPKATFDGNTIVMATTPEAAPAPSGESLKATLKDDNGVLVIQEPISSSN